MSSLEQIYENLSDEVKAKVKDCKTTEDIMKLAQSEGIELTEEQLEAVAGGSPWGCKPYCEYYH